MKDDAERARAAVTDAIRNADEDFGYSIRLTRLVDGEATYTLRLPGAEPMEFESNEDANEYVSAERNKRRADAVLLAFAQQPAKETVSLDDGFTVDLDDDDFTVCWPDGRWLVAHRNGKITVGQSPFDEAVPPKQTTLSAMLDVAPIPGEE